MPMDLGTMRSMLSVFSLRGRAQRTSYAILFFVSFGALIAVSLPWSLFAMQMDKAKVLADMRAKDPNMARTFDTILSAVPHDVLVGLLIAGAVLILGLYVAWIATCVRRLHDMNVTGWLVLLCVLVALVPYLGYLLVSLILGLWPGTKGTNRFGPDPRGPMQAAADIFGSDGTLTARTDR